MDDRGRAAPTVNSTAVPTARSTAVPTDSSTAVPTARSTAVPTARSTAAPSVIPAAPSAAPEDASITAARHSLSRLREKSAAECASAEAALVEIRRLRADRTDDDEHDPEGSPLSSEWARLDGLRRSAQQRTADVEAALQNLAGGHYGTCLRCGEPIAPGRLEALPTATRCVRCAGRR